MKRAKLAIIDEFGVLDPEARIAEQSLPSRLSAAAIRDSVTEQVDTDVPSLVGSLVATQVPLEVAPVVEAQVPLEVAPLVEAQVPPLVEAQVPPLVEAQVPPLVEAQVPPLVATEIEVQVPPLLAVQVPPLVQAQVPPLVASAIAADAGPAAAAAAAVTNEIEGRNLVEGYGTDHPDAIFGIVDEAGKRSWLEVAPDGGPTANSKLALTPFVQGLVPPIIDADPHTTKNLPPDYEDSTFSVVDTAGKRSWIEIGADGGPTTNSQALMSPFVDAKVAAKVASDIAAEPRLLRGTVDGLPAAFAVTDQDGKRAWLEAGDDGLPTAHAVTSIRTALELADPTLQTYLEVSGSTPNRKLWLNEGGSRKLVTDANDPSNPELSPDGKFIYFDSTAGKRVRARDLLTPEKSMLPVKTLVAFGDSLTEALVYVTHTGFLLGIPVVGRGKSGWASADIALRQGGLKPKLTLSGDAIPASGPVTVTAINPSDGWRTDPAGWSLNWVGTLAGVPGTLNRTNTPTVWTFTRTTSGSAVAVPPGTEFMCTENDMYRDHIQTFFSGRNNISATQVSRDEAASIAHLTAHIKQFVVMSVINGMSETQGTGGYNGVLLVNAAKKDLAPNNYLDIRRQFIDRGLAVMGLTPTQADLDKIALDAPPPQLMADDVHPNSNGYRAIGVLLAEYITSKGWTA